MKELKGKYYFCKTMRLFNYLVKNNCDFIRTVQDKNNEKFNVCMFLNNPKLQESLDNYGSYKTISSDN